MTQEKDAEEFGHHPLGGGKKYILTADFILSRESMLYGTFTLIHGTLKIHPIWDIANGTAHLIHKVGPKDAGRYIESCWVLNYLNPCWSAFAWGP